MRAGRTLFRVNGDEIDSATLATQPAVCWDTARHGACGRAKRMLGRSENGLDVMICLADGLHIGDSKVERD